MASRQFGRVVNISSVFGIVSKEKRASYTTSKSALIGLSKTLALDFAAHGVLVNCVSPGFIETELTNQILTPEQKKELIA